MASRPIDFRALRELIPPTRALALMGVVSRSRPGSRACYPCPGGCHDRRQRCVSVNHQVAHCHRCGVTWDAVGLWALHLRVGPYAAALDLCQRLRLEVPYIDR